MKRETKNVGRMFAHTGMKADRMLYRLTVAAALMSATATAHAIQDSDTDPTSDAASIDDMPGLVIDATNYTNFVTTGNPGSLSDLSSPEEGNPLKKVFFIYNIGAKKFLTQGGYWGTHAALSSTPHPFWLQTETETTCDQYATFPGHKDESLTISSTMAAFYTRPTMFVGSQEGTGRSYATYKSITHTQTVNGNTTETQLIGNGSITESPNGTAFTSDAITNMFSGNGSITAVIDLTTCKNPSEHNNKAENILSIGTNIDKWGFKDVTNAYNLHLYYYKDEPATNKWGEGNLEIEYVDAGWNDARRIYTTVNSDCTALTIKVSNSGIEINDGSEAKSFYTNNIKVSYTEGMENRIAYFPKNEDGTYKVGDDGFITADPSLTAETGLPYTYTSTLKADGTDDSQKFFISSLIKKNNLAYSNEGKYLAFSFNKGNDNKADYGVYTDRNITTSKDLDVSNHNNEIIVKRLSQWTFENFKSRDGKNLFYLSLNMPVEDDNRTIETPSDGLWDVNGDDTKYTVDLDQYYVQGNTYNDGWKRNTYYDFDLYENEEDSRDPNKEPTKEPNGKYTDDNYDQSEMLDVFNINLDSETAKWKIVSVYDYYKMTERVKQTAELTSPSDLSFAVLDNDFLRDNDQLRNWTADLTLISTDEEIEAGNAKLRIGVDEYYKPAPYADYYRNSAGKLLTQQDSPEYNKELRNHSRYSGVAITNGGHGKFYQNVTVYTAGWYRVGCKGASNAGATLYATVNNTKASKALAVISSQIAHYMNSTVAKEIYWPFDINHPIYNTVALLNDPFVKSYHKMGDGDCSLWIYVDDKDLQGGTATLQLGIEVPQDATTQSGTAQRGVSIDNWTVANDFKLYYGGKNEDKECLVLDENYTDLSHIDNSTLSFENMPMCLNRSFKLRQWNSLTLPVGLTREQFETAFGTDAKLAKLDHLTAKQIIFKEVNAEDANGYWLSPSTAYIIKPTQDGNQAPYTTTLSQGSGNPKTITVPEGHYRINGVTLDKQWRSDISQAWEFGKRTTKIADKDCKYVFESNTAEGNGTITAYGLLAANYTTGDNNKKNPVDGTFQLNNTYVISNTKLVHVGANGTASKGFRSVFSYNDGNTINPSTTTPELLIMGAGGQTTAIDGIYDTTGNAYGTSNDVYTIDGQLVRKGTATDGLGSGLYIIGGRKVTVK